MQLRIGFVIGEHVGVPVDVVVEALWSPQLLDVEAVLGLGCGNVLHRQPNRFAAHVVYAGHVPAVLSCDQHVVVVGLSLLLFGQITLPQAGKPLCCPAVIPVGVRAELGHYIYLRLDRQQARGGVWRPRVRADRGTDNRDHRTAIVRQRKIDQIAEALQEALAIMVLAQEVEARVYAYSELAAVTVMEQSVQHGDRRRTHVAGCYRHAVARVFSQGLLGARQCNRIEPRRAGPGTDLATDEADELRAGFTRVIAVRVTIQMEMVFRESHREREFNHGRIDQPVAAVEVNGDRGLRCHLVERRQAPTSHRKAGPGVTEVEIQRLAGLAFLVDDER